ncbi:glycoside hydrolase family 19 protein [Parendozoicomonas haliclonae]|uniref:Chitinase class I n=1 Tax=Parendozoicomonas haliclonae TaxID=1960125 RepID=A0A1X7ASX2_9GAMM|nr:glycoside hydrolase family 19 protein [Parendozoicomonas haliclonae]SMA50507.1 Chitinase class I [Parendozoicomonas haliclonae]
MKFKPLVLAMLVAGATLPLTAIAADAYNASQSYPAGEQVSYGGNIYKAKWWANPGQSPADSVENAWDTPWELVGPDEGGPDPDPQPDPDPEPQPDPDPEEPEEPPTGDFPAYKEGTKYNSGDVVLADGKLYRCKEGVAAWCSGAGWAYAPGSGTAWDMAWELSDGTKPPKPDPDPNPNPDGDGDDTKPPVDGDYEMTREELEAKEKEVTSSPEIQSILHSVRTLDNALVEQVKPGAASNPANVKRVEALMDAEDWEFLFPERAPEYTYEGFLKAVAKFPAFCDEYTDGRDSDAICRKSLATMFAHFAQETGGHTAWWDVPEWRQALVHVREMGWDETMMGGYNGECNPDVWQGQTWPCGKLPNGEFKSYFGRGSKQLSYNYNYGPFSQKIYGDVRTLLDNPELVADTWLNLASAVFFFMQPQTPKPSMQDVINGTWQPNEVDLRAGLVPGFGVTTMIINGGVECGGSVEVQQSVNRISYYQEFAKHFNVPVPADEKLGCSNMLHFDAGGAGAVNTYWEMDWSWNPETPDNKSYACQLVAYQTPHSVLIEGDYAKCVQKNFPDVVIVD